MKKIRKILILFLALVISSTTIAGVYAWFMLQPATEALDINVRSTDLFDARANITLNGQFIDYNNTLVDKNSLTITLTRDQVISYTTGGIMNLNLKVVISPEKPINVRLKVVEQWLNGTTVLTRPNVFSWNYANPSLIDSQGYYNHDQVLSKTFGQNEINFVSSANVNTANLPTNSTVRIAIIISATQANRSSNWNLSQSNHIVKTFNVASTISTQSLNVLFTNISNEALKRGIYVEFKSANNHYTYIWHQRSALNERLTLPAANYNVTINLVNHVNFTVTRSGNTININAVYQTPSSWGVEALLYAPSMITNWQPGVNYSTNDIVYYDDADNDGENAGYYKARAGSIGAHPDTSAWAWEIVSIRYNSSRVYNPGEIIYNVNDGKFYRAKQTVWPGNPPPLAWAWEPLSAEFSAGSELVRGKYAYTISGGVRTNYIAYNSFRADSSTPQSWQAIRLAGMEFNSFNYSKYVVGEYVSYLGNYYLVTGGVSWGNPTTNTSNFRRISRTHTSGYTYAANTILFHNSTYYVATASTSQTPGGTGWATISHQGTFNPLTPYSRYQSVIYDGVRYFWNQSGTSTGANPSTSTGWWSLDEGWHYKNTYGQHAYVLHNGDYYTLRTGTSTNQEPGVSGAWQKLSDEWSLTSTYFNTTTQISIVSYNNEMYVWTGTNGSNSTTAPGTARNGWNELTDVWRANNTYKQGDFVIYDGSFWELLPATNPTGTSNVPGIDFNVWKEHPIDWNPITG